jgi:transcriptional regulator of heat shock response
MEDRSQKLLKEIIDIYIRSARPVASSVLSESKRFDLSPATIRNEMYELETQGYITQPHTSAGRVPTIAGYKFYLDNLLAVKTLNSKESKELLDASKNDIRDLAKLLVAKTNLAAIVGFSPGDLYFTGLFNLFSQPEFEDYKMVLSMTKVVDSLEKAMMNIYHQIDKPVVLIGDDNPFSSDCSVAITPLGDGKLLAILGPVRMDYNKILALLEETVKIIK